MPLPQGLGVAAIVGRLAIVQSVLQRKPPTAKAGDAKALAGRSGLSDFYGAGLGLALQLSRFPTSPGPYTDLPNDSGGWLQRSNGKPASPSANPAPIAIDAILAQTATSGSQPISTECDDDASALGVMRFTPSASNARRAARRAADAARRAAEKCEWPEITLPNGMQLHDDSMDSINALDSLDEVSLRAADYIKETVDISEVPAPLL